MYQVIAATTFEYNEILIASIYSVTFIIFILFLFLTKVERPELHKIRIIKKKSLTIQNVIR